MTAEDCKKVLRSKTILSKQSYNQICWMQTRKMSTYQHIKSNKQEFTNNRSPIRNSSFQIFRCPTKRLPQLLDRILVFSILVKLLLLMRVLLLLQAPRLRLSLVSMVIALMVIKTSIYTIPFINPKI